MDQLIKQALEQRAAEAPVPADAWAKQRALLQQAGVAGAFRRPWWRRLGVGVEVAMVAALMVGLVAAGVVYGPLGPGPGGGDRDGVHGGTDVVDPPDAPPDLNPVVIPEPRVLMKEPPAGGQPLRGFLTQEQAVAIGTQAILEHSGVHGGPLTLTSVALNEGKWELKYQANWRVFAMSEGKRPSDPRRPESSHVVPVTEVSVWINDDEGQGKAFGITSNPSQLNGLKLELEHYRGRIVSGGERTELRLTNPDGSREGRDLTIWVANQALGNRGLHWSPTDDTLKLWHLIYGAGREIDVYGLTVAPGEVLAYGLEMKDRPGWELGSHELLRGIPVPDGAKATTKIEMPSGGGAGHLLEGVTPFELKSWFELKMPLYGWKPVPPGPTLADTVILRYENDAWQSATVAITPDPKGARFDLIARWTEMDAQSAQQAVGAVFRELGDSPTYSQFPRAPGSAPGAYNIGGPAPGQTIPATYETRVRKYADGAWEVSLAIIWGDVPYTFVRVFRVELNGGVQPAGQWGEQPPAIP